MNQRKNDILQGTLAFLIYFLLSSIPIGNFFNVLNVDNTLLENVHFIFIVNIIHELITLIIILFIMRKTFMKCFNDFRHNTKYYLSNYIKYWFIALGLMYLSNFIIIFINNGIAANEQSVRNLFEANPIGTFILAGLIAPILEESIFRLSLYKIIGTKKYNKYIFIILSGLLFGLMHIIGTNPTLLDWLYIIPYSIPGCVFAYTLVKSDNICVPISLHAIHNIFALVLQAILMFS